MFWYTETPPLPDKGRNRHSGRSSGGIPKRLPTGVNSRTNSAIAPEVCSMETATPNNLEGGSDFVSGKLEFKVSRSGSGKLVITHKSTSNYAAGVDNLCLMIEQNIPDNITDAAADNNERVDVYTIEGYCIRKNVKASDATKNLRKGIYIIGEKKVVVD